MFGFVMLMGIQAYFRTGAEFLRGSVLSVASAGLMFMVSIVNRGVNRGSGSGMRYGSNVLYLFGNYLAMLVKRMYKTVGPLEIGALALFSWGVVSLIWNIVNYINKDED